MSQTLCQEAGLSAAGIKAELVTRLLDHQQAPAPAAGNALGPTPSVDVAPTAGALPPPVPASVTDAAAATDPAFHATAAATVAVPTEAERRAAIEAELAKRKARAERFGVIAGGGEEASGEAAKKLERAERFGTALDAGADLGALDSALADGKGRRGAGQGRKGQQKAQGGKPGGAGAAAVAAPPKEKTAADLEWEEKKRKRMERFGAGGEDPSAKKQKA